jgi:hypothetical protein
MVAIAVLAVVLGSGVGLKRRVQRLDGLALRYGREANRLENLLEGSNLSQADADAIIERVHWHDAVANQYRLAASRPWVPFDPSPEGVTCECGQHAAR